MSLKYFLGEKTALPWMIRAWLVCLLFLMDECHFGIELLAVSTSLFDFFKDVDFFFDASK